jgi:TfoX/Sxy family transcriptional regulator of competence genes
MGWVKIPVENHAIFLAALPKDRRVSTLQMFGGIAAKVGGHMMGGTFARSVMVRLSPEDLERALALDGAAPFDPMNTGRAMSSMVLLPEDMLDDPAELRAWLERGLEFTATLPKKAAKPAAKEKPAAKKKPR